MIDEPTAAEQDYLYGLRELEAEQDAYDVTMEAESDVHTVTRHTEFYPLYPVSFSNPALFWFKDDFYVALGVRS